MLRFSAKYRRSQSIEWLKVLVGQMLEKLAKQHFEASTDFQIRSAKNRSAMPSTQEVSNQEVSKLSKVN